MVCLRNCLLLVLFAAYRTHESPTISSPGLRAGLGVQGLGNGLQGLVFWGLRDWVWLGFMAPYPAKAVCALSCTCSEITEIAASRRH